MWPTFDVFPALPTSAGWTWTSKSQWLRSLLLEEEVWNIVTNQCGCRWYYFKRYWTIAFYLFTGVHKEESSLLIITFYTFTVSAKILIKYLSNFRKMKWPSMNCIFIALSLYLFPVCVCLLQAYKVYGFFSKLCTCGEKSIFLQIQLSCPIAQLSFQIAYMSIIPVRWLKRDFHEQWNMLPPILFPAPLLQLVASSAEKTWSCSTAIRRPGCNHI